MLKLYRFLWDCGRMGRAEGVFIAEEDEVKNLIDKNVCFGEILGKHSHIEGKMEAKDISAISDDQELIEKLIKCFGKKTICGYNPFTYIE